MAAFHRGRDGTGIDNIIAKIGARVDSRDHNIRARAHQRVNAEIDAVGRRAHLDGDIAIFKGERA